MDLRYRICILALSTEKGMLADEVALIIKFLPHLRQGITVLSSTLMIAQIGVPILELVAEYLSTLINIPTNVSQPLIIEIATEVHC